MVITGPTAAGKSDLALSLAKTLNAEIISVDSRQVYRGMDIGTSKVPGNLTKISNFQFPISNKKSPASSFKLQASREIYISDGIPHHLVDIAHPKTEYNVSHFLQDAQHAIADIQDRGKRVILCGGTIFWIEALMFGLSLPHVAPNKEFRKRWEKKEVSELYGYLKRLDPERAKSIDRQNKVRLLRAIEIAKALGTVPILRSNFKLHLSNYTVLALNPPVEELNAKIRERLKIWLKQGLVKEVEQLHTHGVSWKRLESFGLEYRAIALFLQGKISREELDVTLPQAIIHYAKRQRSSLRRLEKRGVTIHWVNDATEALKLL